MVAHSPRPRAWAPLAPASVSLSRMPFTAATHPSTVVSQLGGAGYLPRMLTLSHPGGGGVEEPLGTFPVTLGARGGRSAAVAVPPAIPPPPQPGVGPLAPPRQVPTLEGTQGHRLAPGHPHGLWA